MLNRYPCQRDVDDYDDEPEMDGETLSLLESRGARDESVGALTTAEWDDLACDCEEVIRARVVEAVIAIQEDARNKAIRLREAA